MEQEEKLIKDKSYFELCKELADQIDQQEIELTKNKYLFQQYAKKLSTKEFMQLSKTYGTKKYSVENKNEQNQ